MAGKTIKVRSGRVVSIRNNRLSIYRNTRRGGRFAYQVKHADGNEKPSLDVEEAVSMLSDRAFAAKVVQAFRMERPTLGDLTSLFPTFGVVFENKRRRGGRHRR